MGVTLVEHRKMGACMESWQYWFKHFLDRGDDPRTADLNAHACVRAESKAIKEFMEPTEDDRPTEYERSLIDSVAREVGCSVDPRYSRGSGWVAVFSFDDRHHRVHSSRIRDGASLVELVVETKEALKVAP
jgi:hypothetical protein